MNPLKELSQLQYWLVVSVLSLAWGTTWAAVRVGLRDVPPLTGVTLRFAIAGVLLLGIAYAKGIKLHHPSLLERRLWWINAVFSFVIPYTVVYWAEQYIPSGLASLLFATYPLFVTLIANFMIPKEGLTGYAWLGMILGFAGTVTLLSGDFELFGGAIAFKASVIFILSPLVSAFATVCIRKYGAGIKPISLTAVPMILTALIVLPFAFFIEWNGPRAADIRWNGLSIFCLLYLALVGSAFTFTLYFWLLSKVPASKAALTAYTIPVVAVLFGAIVLQEPITVPMILGSGLILFGVHLVARKRLLK